MNVTDRILHWGRMRATWPALVEEDHTLTYGELADRVRRTAGHMTAQGLRPGDRVGLCLGDTSNHVIALLATAYAGGVAVPLDWRARPAEIARLIQPLQLGRLLVEPGTSHSGTCLVTVLDDDWERGVSRAHPQPRSDGNWGDPLVIAASSGTTGAPKFTVMTHLQYHFASAGMLELLGLSGYQRFLCSLPLYYSGGRNSCLVHLLRGDCVVLYPSVFNPGEYVDTIQRQGITVGAVVPSMVRQLLAAAGATRLLPSQVVLFCSGAPLHREEKLCAARVLTPNFHERYGTAETLAVCVLRPGDFADHSDSVGQPHSLVRIEVTDDEGRELPTGAVGNLRIRGPGVASPLPGQETASFHGGWYLPGEIARQDESGYLFLHGRASDVIMRSGAKIHPAEVEGVLLEHPNVLEAAVLGHAGTDGEEIVLAFVVPRTRASVGELLAHCRGRLSAHKVPRRIEILSELPKNTAGKADKRALARALADS